MAKAGRRVPPAALRTVGLFDGKTDLEKAEALINETIEEKAKERDITEHEVMDKVRDEWLSTNYHKLDGWRLTRGEGCFLLQKIGRGGACTTSVLLPDGPQFVDLAKQFYMAVKEMHK